MFDFFEFFMIFMDTMFYDFLKFRLKNDSSESYEKGSTHKSVKNSNNLSCIRHWRHITISYSCHCYCCEIKRVKKIPVLDEMKYYSSDEDDNTYNASKK